MALSSYSELVTAITRTIKRSDMSTAIPEWIEMFEKEMATVLRRREMATRATTSTVAGQQAYAKPSEFGDSIDLYLTADTVKRRLRPSDWTRVSTVFGEQGVPEEWAITANEFVLGPIPDDVYEMELYYYKKIPGLSGTNTTNWLLDDYPRLYLYGSLVQSVGAIDDPQQQAWAMAYQDALTILKKDQVKERGFGGGPLLRTDVFGANSISIFTDE